MENEDEWDERNWKKNIYIYEERRFAIVPMLIAFWKRGEKKKNSVSRIFHHSHTKSITYATTITERAKRITSIDDK